MDIVKRFEEASKIIMDRANVSLNTIPQETRQKLKELREEYDKTIADFISTVPDLRIENVVFSKTFIVDTADSFAHGVTSGEMRYVRDETVLHLSAGAPQGRSRQHDVPIEKDKRLKVKIIVTEEE